jgi:hypothetical protein
VRSGISKISIFKGIYLEIHITFQFIVIKMNISKHLSKRFRLNFKLNQSSQNAERHTVTGRFVVLNIPTVHISEIRCYIIKSNNLSTIFGVWYKKYNKN